MARRQPRSNRGLGGSVGGGSFAASLEAGYPWTLWGGWTLEPQVQLIYQSLDLDRTRDQFARISYSASDAVTGRLGLRLQGGTVQAGTAALQPYLRVNLWRDFSGTDSVRFNTTPLLTPLAGTALEIGGGVVARLSEAVSLYGTASWATDVDGDKRETVTGNAGVRVRW